MQMFIIYELCELCEYDANMMCMRHVTKWVDHVSMAR